MTSTVKAYEVVGCVKRESEWYISAWGGIPTTLVLDQNMTLFTHLHASELRQQVKFKPLYELRSGVVCVKREWY